MNASTRTTSMVYVLTANVEDITPGLFGHTLVFILLACPILIIFSYVYDTISRTRNVRNIKEEKHRRQPFVFYFSHSGTKFIHPFPRLCSL